ncbi:MAG: sugar ABC transporter ATP-binding protein [Oscillospiraceae bacterium]
MEYVIELNNITKRFPGVLALNDVSVAVKPQTTHCIIGENGAGKSTLMKIMAGAYIKDSGTILVEGKELNPTYPGDAIAAGIGIVYQEFNNFAHLDVASNLFVGRFPKKGGRVDYKKMYKDARALLERVGLYHISPTDSMSRLSLGAQQLVEIARLLSMNIKVMILDEPTSALTDEEVERLYHLIEDVKSKGVAVVYISHKLDEILHLADEITVLKDGALVQSFANRPGLTKDELVHLMVGRDVLYNYGVGTTQKGEELLRVDNLCSGGAVQNVSFCLHKGEILGLAGLEGSGRTEVLEALFGWRPTTDGKIFKSGSTVKNRSPVDAKKNHFAYITKERKVQGLFLELNAEQNISAASSGKYVTGGLVDYKKITATAEDYRKAMQIKLSGTKQKVGNLSGGNQQKVLLSMWLAANPDIILIDEPTRGIDVGAKAEIHMLLRRLVGEGKGIIMVSSEMTELMASCDRILVFYEGKITGELANSEATERGMMKLASGIVETA